MRKRFILVLLVLFLLFVIGCSTEDALTGGSTVRTTEDVSTLMVTVEDENGKLLDGAEIYVNNVFKGKTNRYGSSQGTRTVVLTPEENEIRVEKEGYIPSRETSIIAQAGQIQAVTLMLEKKKTEYRLIVRDENGNEVDDAKVLLFSRKGTAPLETIFTNRDGIATFEKLPDGAYTFRINHEDYEKATLNEDINYAKNGKLKLAAVTLSTLPHLAVRVVDADDEPIARVEVALYSKESYNSPNSVPLTSSFNLFT